MQYAINRHAAIAPLLRRFIDTTAQNPVGQLILAAYTEYEEQVDA